MEGGRERVERTSVEMKLGCEYDEERTLVIAHCSLSLSDSQPVPRPHASPPSDPSPLCASIPFRRPHSPLQSSPLHPPLRAPCPCLSQPFSLHPSQRMPQQEPNRQHS